MGELEKLHEELTEALDRYKIWCERVDKKEILFRNTKEEIAELDKDIKREIILPIIAKIKWLQLINE
tara:strand:+ start:10789 stop:10989 length:201 start_codon:yes stop_codon:yes gene_type:complete